jgi:hypothetical protein
MVLFSWIQRSSRNTEKEAWCDATLHGPPQELRRADAEAVAEAHQKDLEAQDKRGAKALKYWLNGDKGEVFCLFDTPNAEAAEAVHREAHGLLADEIVEGE